MAFVDRENEVLRVLGVLATSGPEFVVVGGCAVSALARHRFSVDCDLVVRHRDLKRLDVILRQEGFAKAAQQSGFDETYGGTFIRYTKKVAELPVSVDLLVDALVCRETTGGWSFDYILSQSAQALVPGIQLSVTCRIPQRELLIAFKLHSARKADVRDVVLLGDAADWRTVAQHVRRGDEGKLALSLRRVLTDLEDQRLVPSLKGVFSLKADVAAGIARTRREVQKLLAVLPGG